MEVASRAYQPTSSSSVTDGRRLLLPSELKARGQKPARDWGECILTFDKIRDPVRAGDGSIYERWAITKWLAENNNRSPLTNQNIGSELQAVGDDDEGVGARHVLQSAPQTPRNAVLAPDPGDSREGTTNANNTIDGTPSKPSAAHHDVAIVGAVTRQQNLLKEERDAQREQEQRAQEVQMAKLLQKGFQPYQGYSPQDKRRESPSAMPSQPCNHTDISPTQLSGLVPPSQLPHNFSPACSVIQIPSQISPDNLGAMAMAAAPPPKARDPALIAALSPALHSTPADRRPAPQNPSPAPAPSHSSKSAPGVSPPGPPARALDAKAGQLGPRPAALGAGPRPAAAAASAGNPVRPAQLPPVPVRPAGDGRRSGGRGAAGGVHGLGDPLGRGDATGWVGGGRGGGVPSAGMVLGEGARLAPEREGTGARSRGGGTGAAGAGSEATKEERAGVSATLGGVAAAGGSGGAWWVDGAWGEAEVSEAVGGAPGVGAYASAERRRERQSPGMMTVLRSWFEADGEAQAAPHTGRGPGGCHAQADRDRGQLEARGAVSGHHGEHGVHHGVRGARAASGCARDVKAWPGAGERGAMTVLRGWVGAEPLAPPGVDSGDACARQRGPMTVIREWLQPEEPQGLGLPHVMQAEKAGPSAQPEEQPGGGGVGERRGPGPMTVLRGWVQPVFQDAGCYAETGRESVHRPPSWEAEGGSERLLSGLGSRAGAGPGAGRAVVPAAAQAAKSAGLQV